MSEKPTVRDLYALAMELDSEERLDLLHRLLDAHHSSFTARKEQRSSGKPSWLDFLNQTYGSLADDPLERASQGEYEQRDEFR